MVVSIMGDIFYHLIGKVRVPFNVFYNSYFKLFKYMRNVGVMTLRMILILQISR
jgi:hypothetical protein